MIIYGIISVLKCDSEVHAIPIGEFGHLNSWQTGQWNGLFHTHVDLSKGFEHDITLISGCSTFLLTESTFYHCKGPFTSCEKERETKKINEQVREIKEKKLKSKDQRKFRFRFRFRSV